MGHRNLEKPNFISCGQLFLVRCYECEPKYGRENYLLAVATGQCAWCGWEGGDKIVPIQRRGF